MLEDYEKDIFRSGKGIYFDCRHYVEMEKNNPHGLGDYPRRMIVVDKETKNSMENENERRKERAGSENS